MNAAPDDLHCRIGSLHVHPVKSCGGIAVGHALLADTGLALDRQWMVVDAHGNMLTQRAEPRMALIQPSLTGQTGQTNLTQGALVLRAPGMLALHVRLDASGAPTRVRVWDDVVKALDMGDVAAQWLVDVLGPGCGPALRLVRFDPHQQRLADRAWTGAVEAPTAFADGYPLLVAGNASLDDLNARLAARRQGSVAMQRFRPNIVLDGLQGFDEDNIGELTIGTAEGPVTLRLVKPCVRCTIPNVDPATAATSNEPGDTLATFRADARMHGGITFGMNAVVVRGFGCVLRVGQPVSAGWAFD